MIFNYEQYNKLISIINDYKSRKASKINLEEEYRVIRKKIENLSQEDVDNINNALRKA